MSPLPRTAILPIQGENESGQLGVGANAPAAGVPTPVAGGKACSVVSASAWAPIACCLLAVERTVECWGAFLCPLLEEPIVSMLPGQRC